ncbi:unnamed protein product [Prunus armeniaca]|uniref:Growth-regulating factor n=1 Tax=Prunus armeniaca TaxID=36596 RepID=A0A6J5V516_PRUAR|nr:unnamed protein product [Prunus armeniaca]
MDFGVMGLEGLVGPEGGATGAGHSLASDPETKPKGHAPNVPHGSGSVKQQRSWPAEDDWRTSKMPKNDDLPAHKTMPLQYQGTPLLRSNSLLPADTHRQEQMLSFSNNKSEVTFLSKDGMLERNIQGPDFAYYQRTPALTPSAYTRNAAAYGSGSINPSMHGPFAGVRGPFTPSQWIELEHQALIYKYMTSNVPVPSNLLIPLKKSLYPYGLSGSTGNLAPNSLAWGSYHLGFSGNTDPEPGRCRRTDGKKWRCSRDAVADQKYCERHINRGRHRSRKPVEGQPGQAASGTSNSKGVPMTSSTSTPVMPSSGTSNNVATMQNQFKSLQPAGAANPSADAFVNRMQDPRGLSVMSASTIKPKASDSRFNMPKQEIPLEESSQSEFGLVSTDSLLNPSHRNSYISKDFGGSFLDFSDQEAQDQHPLRQFIDDWPKDQSSHSVSTWPDEIKSDWTQLSMSIPMTSSEFSSSSSSPTQEKRALSPLRLSREFEPAQMNLGVSNEHSESSQKTNWIPIPWGNSMGGPLGEVLTNTTSSGKMCNNSVSPLNLLNEGWDGSPQLGSSPTGVLQKSTFCSLSNSSSGSSPRGENKKNLDGASIYDDVLGSTFASSSVPSL